MSIEIYRSLHRILCSLFFLLLMVVLPAAAQISEHQIPEGTVSIRAFGAVGDGATDDRGAFERAIASEKDIFVPPTEHGYYLADDQPDLTPEDEGYRSYLLHWHGGNLLSDGARIWTDASKTLIRFENVDSLRLRGLTFEAPRPPYPTNGIPVVDIVNCHHFLIDDTHGIGGSSFRIRYSQGGTIQQSSVRGTSYMGFFALRSEDLTFIDCSARDMVSGLRTEGARNVRWINCTVENTYGQGIRIEDSHDVSVEGGLVENSSGGALIYGANTLGAPPSWFDGVTRRITIDGTLFRNCWRPALPLPDVPYVKDQPLAIIEYRFRVDELHLAPHIENDVPDMLQNIQLAPTVLNPAIAWREGAARPLSASQDHASFWAMNQGADTLVLLQARPAQSFPGQDWLFHINHPEGTEGAGWDLTSGALSLVMEWDVNDINNSLGPGDYLLRFYSEPDRQGRLLGEIFLRNMFPGRLAPLRVNIWPEVAQHLQHVRSFALYKNTSASLHYLYLSDLRIGLRPMVGIWDDTFPGYATDVTLEMDDVQDVEVPHLTSKPPPH